MRSLILIFAVLFSSNGAFAGELWPEALYERLSRETTKKVISSPTRETWHGGMMTDAITGNRVGLVLWSAVRRSNIHKDLVVSCADDTATEDPETVVFVDNLFGDDPRDKLTSHNVQVKYKYDNHSTQTATWFLVDRYNGGLYVQVDGDDHVRSMIAGSRFYVNTARRDGKAITDEFSLTGFTSEFEKACGWHPNYQDWITS